MRTPADLRTPVVGRWVIADGLSAVTLVAAVFGSWIAYGRSDLTLDEGYTSAETQLRLGSLLQVFWSRELNGSLHTLLMWALDRPGPALLRLTSTVFMIAALVLLHRCSRRHFGPWPAFASLVVAATNPAIQQDMVIGRTYALSLLLLMTSFSLLDRAVRGPTTLAFVAWGCMSGVMLYAHFLTGLVVAGQVLWLLVFHRDRLRQWLAGLGAALVLFLPIGLFLISGGGSRGQLVVADRPSVGALARGLLAVVAGYARVATATQAFMVVVVLAIVALGVTGRTRRPAALGIFTFATPVMVLAVGAQVAPSLFSERYLVFTIPGLALAVGAGIRSCIDRSGRLTLVTTTTFTACSVVFSLLATVSLATTPWSVRHPWSAAMQAVGVGQNITTAVPAEGYVARLYAERRGAAFLPGIPGTAMAFLEESSYRDRTCASLAWPDRPVWVATTMSTDLDASSSKLLRCNDYRAAEGRTYGSVHTVELVPAG